MTRRQAEHRCAVERITEAGAVFETNHDACSAMRYHRHPTPFATIVLRGGYVEVRDCVPGVCRRGMLVIHDAAEEHADRFGTDTHCLNVELATGPKYSRQAIALDSPALRDAVHGVVRSFYEASPALASAVTRLQRMLAEPRPAAGSDRPNWLDVVLESFPWAEPIPLREAAAMVGLHETHFSRAFRHYVGVTAIEYRAQARLTLASKLMLNTAAPLACVAINAGFSDQSHLTRAFSERLGLSPAGYRRTFAR